MNAPIKRISSKTLALLTVLLAAVLGMCALSVPGSQGSAWAASDEKPLFTTGNITKLPFEKSKDNFKIEISAVDDSSSSSSSPADITLKDSDQKAESNADAKAGEGKADADADAKANAEGDQSATGKVAIKITVKKDTDAGRVEISVDGKKVTKDIKDGKLKEKSPLTITVANCKKIESIAIYAEKADAKANAADGKADSSSSSKDDSAAKADSASNGDKNAPAILSLFDDGNGKDDSAGKSGDNTPATTALNDEGTGKDDSSDGTKPEGDPSHAAPFEVTFDGTSEDLGTWTIHVTSGSPFGEGITSDGSPINGIDEYALVKDGYTFVGWADASGNVISDSTVINENITVTPQFTKSDGDPAAASEPAPRAAKATVMMSFDANGHGKAPNGFEVTIGETVNLDDTAPEKVDGYAFTGWFTDKKCTAPFDAANTPVTQDITLYAKWVRLCTVTFDLGKHGGSQEAITVSEGDVTPQIPTPTEEGWTFERWLKDNDETFIPGETPVTQDITVHAVWVENIPTDESQSVVVNRDAAEAETFSITVTKVNIDNGKCLEGAEFTLEDKAGNVIGSWTSNNAGVMIEKLRRDTTYVLYETKAPDGFGVEKPININFVEENGASVVKIDQGGVAVPLTNNDDGIASLNVKDTAGNKKTVGTTMPQTGDNQNLPVAIACFAGAAAIAAGVIIVAARKRKK